MSHITRVSPSTKGSKPVSEVLKRLQIQDPRQVSTTPYGRRMMDYESRAPKLQTLAMFLLAAIIASGFWSVSLQKFAAAWNAKPEGALVSAAGVLESLSIPEGLHPFP